MNDRTYIELKLAAHRRDARLGCDGVLVTLVPPPSWPLPRKNWWRVNDENAETEIRAMLDAWPVVKERTA